MIHQAMNRAERAGKLAAIYTKGFTRDQITARAVRNSGRWHRKLLREGMAPFEALMASRQVENQLIIAWKRSRVMS